MPIFFTNEEIKALQSSRSLAFEDTGEEIFVRHIKSPIQGSGFGTKMMHYFVSLSLERGYAGNVALEAAWSSHLFHLYMGMIPGNEEAEYIMTKYGDGGEGAIEQLAQCNNDQEFYRLGLGVHSLLKEVLVSETNRPSREITHPMLWEQREVLLGLQTRTCSFISEVFIPKLLRCLKRSSGNKYPDTSHLGSISMHLSEEGKARWIEAIDTNSGFMPFKRLEHLQRFLTESQREELKSLLPGNLSVGEPESNERLRNRYEFFSDPLPLSSEDSKEEIGGEYGL